MKSLLFCNLSPDDENVQGPCWTQNLFTTGVSQTGELLFLFWPPTDVVSISVSACQVSLSINIPYILEYLGMMYPEDTYRMPVIHIIHVGPPGASSAAKRSCVQTINSTSLVSIAAGKSKVLFAKIIEFNGGFSDKPRLMILTRTCWNPVAGPHDYLDHDS